MGDEHRVLALDLGATTGFAFNRDGELHSGVWSLSKAKDHPGARFLHFRASLGALLVATEYNRIYFEEPYIGMSRATAIHSMGGYRAVVLEFAFVQELDAEPVAPSQLKKWATGRGNARKPDMIARASELAGRQVEDDNEADAICLLAMALDREAVT